MSKDSNFWVKDEELSMSIFIEYRLIAFWFKLALIQWIWISKGLNLKGSKSELPANRLVCKFQIFKFTFCWTESVLNLPVCQLIYFLINQRVQTLEFNLQSHVNHRGWIISRFRLRSLAYTRKICQFLNFSIIFKRLLHCLFGFRFPWNFQELTLFLCSLKRD